MARLTKDRSYQLRAGRAYNRMNDYEAGSDAMKSDPTGDLGWIILTIRADRQCEGESYQENGGRSYDDILSANADSIISAYGGE